MWDRQYAVHTIAYLSRIEINAKDMPEFLGWQDWCNVRYKRLGKSDIKVSEIGFGAWTIAMDWWGKKIPEDEAIRMLKKAYDIGINFFETGDMYGKGKSEMLIGQALAGISDVVISTKYGYDFEGVSQIGHSELPQRFDPGFTKKAIQKSLERLQRDHVDVYGLHNPKLPHIRDDTIFETLDLLMRQDMIRAYQVALGPAIGWTQEGLEAMDRPGLGAIQTVYNILEQNPGNELLQRAVKKDVGVLVRVPDASGILTGKVNADTKIDEKDHRSVRKGEWIRQSLQKVEQLRPIAERCGLGILELAIKFILSRQGISSVIPTMVSVDEIEEFAALSDGRYVDPASMREIDELFASWPAYELKSTMPA